MKRTMIITSVISRLQVPASVVEDLVNHRKRKEKYILPVSGIEKNLFFNHFETVLTYTMQASVKGNLQIRFSKNILMDETIEIPAISSFLITCMKGREARYHMELCSSLN